MFSSTLSSLWNFIVTQRIVIHRHSRLSSVTAKVGSCLPAHTHHDSYNDTRSGPRKENCEKNTFGAFDFCCIRYSNKWNDFSFDDLVEFEDGASLTHCNNTTWFPLEKNTKDLHFARTTSSHPKQEDARRMRIAYKRRVASIDGILFQKYSIKNVVFQKTTK